MYSKLSDSLWIDAVPCNVIWILLPGCKWKSRPAVVISPALSKILLVKIAPIEPPFPPIILLARMIFEVLFPIVTTVLFSSKGSNSGDDSSRALMIPYEVWPILPVYLAAIDGSLIVLE